MKTKPAQAVLYESVSVVKFVLQLFHPLARAHANAPKPRLHSFSVNKPTPLSPHDVYIPKVSP